MLKLAILALAGILMLPTALPAAVAAHGGNYPAPPVPDPPPEPPPPSPPPAPPPSSPPSPGGSGPRYDGPGDGIPGRPRTPGPGGPSTPSNGPSAPATPGPSGPSSPPAAGPANPPAGPRPQSPDLGATLDRYDWQVWWHNNRAPYLNLKAAIHEITATGGDDFFIGHGQSRTRVSPLVPSRAVLQAKVLPVLIEAIRVERNNDIVTSALIAAAKIGASPTSAASRELDEAIRSRLADPVQEIGETALLALGIAGDEGSFALLRSVMLDQPAGRAAIGKPATPVNGRSRSFACYALGLLGNRTSVTPLRQLIVQDLVTVLQGPRQAGSDLKTAAALSFGLIPVMPLELEAAGDTQLGPWASREHQLAFASEFFAGRRGDGLRPSERAHMARSIALLLEGCSELQRVAAAEQLIEAVGGRTRPERVEVRQSAVLALGGIGDCDGDAIDKAIRRALFTALADPDPQVQNFALISIGRVGGRVVGNGTGELSGRRDLRTQLARELSHGRRRRAWAGLAIGVMERELADAGAPRSPDMLAALSESLSERRSGNEAAAYAIALGLAGDLPSAPILLEQLENQSEDRVRSQIAIGLGLMRAAEAGESLEGIVAKSRYRAVLLEHAAVALGLIGDAAIAPELARMLREEANSLSSQAAIAPALGFIGDARSIDPLLEMFADDELTDGARAFALVALGIVGDRDLLPWGSKLTVDLNYFALTESLVGGGNGVLEIL
jgi:HEAT repeat protein